MAKLTFALFTNFSPKDEHQFGSDLDKDKISKVLGKKREEIIGFSPSFPA